MDNLATVKMLCTDIFFNRKWNCEPTNKPYLVLDEFASESDAAVFLAALLIINSIDGDLPLHDAAQALLEEEYLILGGGFGFFSPDDNNSILPGCCAGLEQWPEFLSDIENKNGIWLGHDSFPMVRYENDTVILFPDSEGSSPKGAFSIRVDQKILTAQLSTAVDDLKTFFDGPLSRFTRLHIPLQSTTLRQKLRESFFA